MWRYRGGVGGDKFVNSGCHFIADYSLELDWHSELYQPTRKEREEKLRKSHYHLN